MDDECKKCHAEDRRRYDRQIEELYNKICTIEERLDPVIEVWSALSGMAKVLRWVGIFVKWLAIFTAFFISLKVLGGK